MQHCSTTKAQSALAGPCARGADRLGSRDGANEALLQFQIRTTPDRPRPVSICILFCLTLAGDPAPCIPKSINWE